MKNNILVTFIILTTICVFNLYGQNQKYFMAANWNLENLFDTTDDPNKNDVEFTPESKKEWTQERLNEKLSNLSKVISSMNNGKGPDLLGVEEVEHEALLDSLIKKYIH